MPADADAAFADFLRRREAGEDLDFDALCAEHPEFADALKVLQSVHTSQNTTRGSAPDETAWVLPVTPAKAGSDAGRAETAEIVRFCIQCGKQIGSSPLCTNPDCQELPNYYLYVAGPEPKDSAASEGARRAVPPSRQDAEREARSAPVSGEAPLAVLRSVSPPAVEHLVYPGLTTIGARPPARIIIDHASISSKHAALKCARSRSRWVFALADRGSTNGTYVNGERIKRCRVKSGDRLRFAKIEFELRLLERDEQRLTIQV